MPENTQSAREPWAFWAYSDIEVASGASGDVVGIDDEDPMCMDTVVSVSAQVDQRTSQSPVYIDGRPSLAGFSVKAMA